MLSDWEREVRRVLDEMPARARAELLRALRLCPEALDEEIAGWEPDPRTVSWTAMLLALQRELDGDAPRASA